MVATIVDALTLHPGGINGSWDEDEISDNPGLTWKYVKDHPDGVNGGGYNLKLLSANPCVNERVFADNPDYEWFMKNISINRSIPFSFILANIDKYDWGYQQIM
jgi:hypothetical protein